MPIFPNLLLSLILVFSLFADAEAEGANPNSTHAVRVQELQALQQRDGACSSKEHEGLGLKIVDRYGPCSPLAEPHASPFQILERDQSRVKWLQSQQLNKAPYQFDAQDADLPARPGISLGTGNYIVTVGFGTPKKDMTVAFDTGSSLTWIQCQPCAGSCYQQQEPIFNPAQSSSYVNISCNSADCSQVGVQTFCRSPSSTCVYGIGYGDGSISQGYLAHDTLTLTASDVFPNFEFGCGQFNRGLFGAVAGLLGLGRSEISLVYQTASKFGQVFSYCLPSTPSSTGYLKFGAEAIPAGVRYTPLLGKQEEQSYFVSLVSISVGGVALPIPASTFSSGPGTIIDSGTVISRLSPAVYSALRSAFRQAMSTYKMAASPVSLFDTCYDLSGVETVSVPGIVLSFEGGVDVEVVPSGILVVGVAEGQRQTIGCLAFAQNKDSRDVAIIGNTQQAAFDVVYDVAGGRVGFRPGSC